MNTFAQYAARGRTDWWRYPVAVIVALIAWIVLIVIGVLALFATGQSGPQLSAEMTSPTHPVIFFAANGIVFGLLTAGFVAGIALAHRKSFGDIVGRWSWPLFGLGAGLWLALNTLGVAADYGLAPHGFTVTASSVTPAVALSVVLGLGVQTFTEEFVFRGYLTQGLLRLFKRPLPAAVVSGLAFGALHIPNGWPQAAGAVVFGIIAALIAIRTGGIALTYGLHLVNNVFGAVFVVSANDVFKGAPGLITVKAPQLLWPDTAFEALALLAVLWFVFRRVPADAKPDETSEGFA